MQCLRGTVEETELKKTGKYKDKQEVGGATVHHGGPLPLHGPELPSAAGIL